MKALLVSSEFPPGPGGIGTHASELASGLVGRGWDVGVATSQDYATDAEIAGFNRAQTFGITRFRSVPGAPLEALYRESVLARLIRRDTPDVLIASGSRSVLLAAARWAGRRRPWIAIGHGTEFGRRRGWEAAAVRAAFRRATAVVCVSEYTRRQMRDAGIHPSLDAVIPNGADPERFRRLPGSQADGVRRELGIPEGALIVTVGNVTRRKGQDVVVRALPAILERIPSVQYALAGLPSRSAEIRRLAGEMGVSERVHLLGRLDATRLVRLLNAADVFAMTSRRTEDGDFEGYGIAVVEAALCGCPSVVAADSGLAEAIEDGRTGESVPQDDPSATARAIVALLEDTERRRAMGQAARERAEREQTWAHRIAQYEALLREVTAPAAATAPPKSLTPRAL